jgi:hypothetical protein
MMASLFPLLVAGVGLAQSRPASEARLELVVFDAETGQPVQARVRIRDARRLDVVPPGMQVVRIGARDRWFVCPGKCSVDLPAGTIDLRVERGTEYRPFRQKIELVAGSGGHHVVTLTRWVNMRDRGYVCGEDHLHVPAETLASQLVAEGLDFGTSLQWWNGPYYKVPPGNGFIRDLVYAGRQVPASIYDFEIEQAWGAAYGIGVPAPLEAKEEPRRPNLPLLRQAHEAGALVCYQSGWSREVLLDALLGFVDVVNVCNNNFHRHQFQPRSRYSNLLDVPGLPTYPDTPDGMMQMNTDTYYRLLNCGLRLAAGAGSATGAKDTPVGYNRAYVRAGAKPTLPQFLSAWRAGRNFVTNGPMLFLKVDEHQPGDVISLGAGGVEVTLRAEALSEQPLTSLEIVSNGKVIAKANDVKGSRAELVAKLTIQEPCWIAARCTEHDEWLTDNELTADHDYGDRLLCKPCRLRFAHTSPVYITVGNRPVQVPESVDEARRMLDAFEVFGRREVAEKYREELIAALAQARANLLKPNPVDGRPTPGATSRPSNHIRPGT